VKLMERKRTHPGKLIQNGRQTKASSTQGASRFLVGGGIYGSTDEALEAALYGSYRRCTSLPTLRGPSWQAVTQNEGPARWPPASAGLGQPSHWQAPQQSAVRHSHLDYYRDKFTFRFNRRTSASRGKIFNCLAEQGCRN
jgi:hypothetical protein